MLEGGGSQALLTIANPADLWDNKKHHLGNMKSWTRKYILGEIVLYNQGNDDARKRQSIFYRPVSKVGQGLWFNSDCY